MKRFTEIAIDLILCAIFGIGLAMILTSQAWASPSDDDLGAYRARLQYYLALKQTPEQITVSLGNWFGRQGSFHVYYNADGTVDISYAEGDGNTIRFFAPLERIRPVYEVVK